MNLSSVQQRAVDELFNYFADSYNDNNINKIIEFKAPTGSGKTFMISNFIDKASIYHHDLNQDQKIIFVIATLSSAKLPIQMESNINEYLSYLQNKDLKVKRYDSPSSSSDKLKDGDYRIIANNNEIIIFGTQSFGKGKIYTEQGIFNAFLDQIAKENYKLVYIRDEAHIGSEKEEKNASKFLDYDEISSQAKDESVRFEQKIQEAASFIIKMTATPKGKYEQVIITEKDLESDSIHLLKNKKEQNSGLKFEKLSTIDNIQLLKIAIKKFKEIKDKYIDFKNEPGLVNINPAMLIQVSDKFKGNEKEFEENIDSIVKTLKENGLTYAKYFSSEKIDSDQRAIKSLQDISRNSSDIDAIIFKVGPATGWNIPRACMLIQLRNISSNTLNIQTIGRIKRNPNPNYPFATESIANQYFIYTNNEIKDSDEIVTYRLKKQYMDNHIKFGSGKINIEIHKQISNSKEYKEKIIALLDKNKVQFYLDEALENYNKNGYLNGLVIKYKDENKQERDCVYQKIYNILELQKFNNKFQVQNRNILTKDIISNIKSWFYKQKFNKSIHLFWYILKNNYFDLIVTKYKQGLESIKNKTRDKEYLLEFSNTLPQIFSISKDENKTNINISDEHYAYQNIIKNSDQNKYYTDSEAENKFLSRMAGFIADNEDLANNIKIWTKNPVHEGISYQYYSENDISIANSYPDILIVIEKNEKKHQLVIEIKSGIKDLTPEKSEALLEAYKKYVDEFSIPLFNEIESLTIAICRAKDDELIFEGYSSKDEIDNLLCNKINGLGWIRKLLK